MKRADRTRARLLKRGILLFWSVWISIVVLMNSGNALKAAGFLPSDWKLSSGNYQAIAHVTAIYGVPHWADAILFAGVILWESVALILFWRAFRTYPRSGASSWRAIYLAFTTLFGLFAAFILTDEIFHDYKVEADHRGIALLLLVSLLAMHVLPDRLPD